MMKHVHHSLNLYARTFIIICVCIGLSVTNVHQGPAITCLTSSNHQASLAIQKIDVHTYSMYSYFYFVPT